jgi:hypothetical protein
MSVLTTSQLTFCDLKDSYSIHVDTECVGVVCDNNGMVSEEQTATINYRAFAGSTRVGVSCDVYDIPDGITLSRKTPASSTKDGIIEFVISKDSMLNNEVAHSVKIVFTTIDTDQFTFEKYITFVKSMAGHDGTDAVDFQIYSVDGFEFSDYVTTIQLKTVAFKNGQSIDANATYRWMWWDKVNDTYKDIPDATSHELAVNIDDPYAFTSLKCEMLYDNITYDDYVSLTKQAAVYTAMAKFFNGNNVIESGMDYLLAYVELYKDSILEERLAVNKVYVSDANKVQDNMIITDIDGEYESGSMMYFAYQTKYNNALGPEYDVVLGKYVVLDEDDAPQWHVVPSKYVYVNDLFAHATSQIVFIPKEQISKTLNINFEVRYENNVVARTSAMALDLNDPSVGESAPQNPPSGQLWLDTHTGILKMWDGTQWVNSGYQNGNVVYTSKPTKYEAGDLWIVASGEEFGQFTYGAMLRAKSRSDVFKESDWVDAMDIVTTITNIKESFTWNDSGVQIAQRVTNSSGNYTTPFYVHISSTRMGFHGVDESGKDSEVVHIATHSAVIKNATFVDSNANPEKYAKYEDTNGARFDCNATFDRQLNICKVDEATDNPLVTFAWTVEANNSLSLTIV